MPTDSTPPAAPAHPAESLRHGYYEDAQALFAGTLFVAMALMLFGQAGLLIGSTAGVAFLLHYLTDISFGKLFFAINLPFYWFAWTRMGREFTVKTFLSVALLSALTEMFPHVMHVDYLNPLFAAVLGGLLLGTGCLFLARHRSSLGGATILSLYLQQSRGIRAGKVQMAIDCVVVLLALFVVPPDRVAYSVLAVLVMSGFLWISHRPGRYVGH
ncbi:YitT family protein [Acidovorax sp. FG27]|uniref:YitT family protein n=1 Tax=Acidovorax sp. FG27 TaxID=3133652 RepID=UPI0030E95EFA